MSGKLATALQERDEACAQATHVSELQSEVDRLRASPATTCSELEIVSKGSAEALAKCNKDVDMLTASLQEALDTSEVLRGQLASMERELVRATDLLSTRDSERE